MKRKSAILIVNFITFIRVLGTILMPFIAKVFSAEQLIIYITILLLTDSIDGILARKLEVSCIFGALLDALADKILGIATLCILVKYYPIIILPILSEILIIIINTYGGKVGSKLESSKLGKCKTWIMGIAIVIGLLTIYSNEFITLFDENNLIGIKTINIFHYLNNNSSTIMYSLAFITLGCDLMVLYDYYTRVKNDIKNIKKEGIEPKMYQIKQGKDLLFALFDHEYYVKTLNEPIIKRLGVKKNAKKIQK